MKRVSRKMYPAIVAGALLASACIGVNKREPSSTNEDVGVEQAFVADSLQWEDSLRMGRYKANVRISGMYPSGGVPLLVDSLRTWIAEQLACGGYGDCRVVAKYDTASLVDGNVLVAAIGRAYMDSARVDFDRFMQDTVCARESGVEYEQDYSFMPIFRGDSILTYSFSGYAYLGGAHGSALGIGQSFAISTGKRLSASDMFLPDGRERLRTLLADGLWKQYFRQDSINGGESSLDDALLIASDTLPLPACPPMCVDTGMVFIYQQYEIACYAAGMPACVLPYRVLRPLLRPEVARLLPE